MNKITTFAERLKAQMDEAKMSTSDLCRLTSLDRSLVWHYLHGTKQPKAENLRRIAAVLFVNSEWLEGYDVEKTPKPVQLSPLENDMLISFRSCSGEDKYAILEFIKNRASK